MSHSHDPKDYSSSVMELYDTNHVMFRREKILDHVEFPMEYFIVEPVMVRQEDMCCGLLDDKVTITESSIGQRRRKFVLDRVEKYCNWRYGFYHEVVDQTDLKKTK